jgi:predicted RNA-binding Zn ribbon-like protein
MMLVMADSDRGAPDRLEVIRQFVNSLEVEIGKDELGSPEGAQQWLTAHGLPGSEKTPKPAELERLVAVREAIRTMLLANNAAEPAPAEALATLNDQAAEAAVGLRFDSEGSALVTRCGGVDAAIASLLAVVHEAMHDGTWERLKACRDDDCQWAFYDRSRNRSGAWCEMDDCGNRAKARAYRERRRAQATAKSKR